jgi:hypothetical protein
MLIVNVLLDIHIKLGEEKMIGNRRSKFFIIFLFLTVLCVLSSCAQNSKKSGIHPYSSINALINQKEIPPLSFFTGVKLPIPISGQFSNSVGWLNNEEILYVTNDKDLNIYNLKSGENRSLFVGQHPIVTTLISPDRNKILIHTSPSTFEGILLVIDLEGNSLYNERLPSTEIIMEWNQFDTNQILITTFKQDWSFENHLLNLSLSELNKVDFRKPFGKWVTKEKLIFLDWSEDDLSLLSPLVQSSLNQEEEIVAEDVFHFDVDQETILTITIDSSGGEKAKYSFFNEQMNEKASFQVPVLTNYSEWLIPYYELHNSGKIIIFAPKESGEADSYNNTFQLMSFDINSNAKDIILEDSDNVPFTCSPNLDYCLMGYQLESLFNLHLKKLLPLF